MRTNDGSNNYLLGNHLGSVSTVVNASGEIISQSWYLLFGELLWEDGDSPTDYSYTGSPQTGAGCFLSDIGLMDYNTRFYDPMLGRFTSPDSIFPDSGSAIGYNRYAYVANNPMIYTDPSGHVLIKEDDETGTPITDVYNTPAHRVTLIQAIQNRLDSLGISDNCSFPMGCASPGNLWSNDSVSQYHIQSNSISVAVDDDPSDDLIITGTYDILTEPLPAPWYIDRNPENPDYAGLNISFVPPASPGITLVVIRDRYDNLYGGAGLNYGKSLTVVNAGFTYGWAGDPFDNENPDVAELEAFLSGFSINASAGAVGGLGVTVSPFAKESCPTAPVIGYEGSMMMPSAGVSAIYTVKISK